MRWPILLLLVTTCHRAELAPVSPREESPPPALVEAKIDFTNDVLPIVRRCEPCHFAGGSMYSRLPFDRAETIEELGTRLFTRIKDEDEQKTIRAFLAERSR